MNPNKIQNVTIYLAVFCTIMMLVNAVIWVSYIYPNIGKIKGEGPEDPTEAMSEADFLIWRYNTTYYAARNMSSLMVETFTTNLTYACLMTDANLTTGGLIFLKGVQKPAAYTPSANIVVWESYQGEVKIYTDSSSGKIGDCPETVSGNFILQSNTTEQTMLTITPSVTTRLYNFFIDLNTITQNITVRVYIKIDGSNYRLMPSMTLGLTYPDETLGLALKELWIDTDMKITLQSGVVEGATRTVYYRYFKEEY